MRRNLLFFCLACALACSCGGGGGPEEVAERFLGAYLDCDFARAQRMASEGVADQLWWRASQLTEADLEVLNGREGSVEVEAEETRMTGADSCLVWLRARDALLMDSIGQVARIGEGNFCVALKKGKGSNWKVTALNP